MSGKTEQTHAISKLAAYLRRQGGQCNAQQPIVPVAGSELLKAAEYLEALPSTPIDDEGLRETIKTVLILNLNALMVAGEAGRGNDAAQVVAERIVEAINVS